MINTNLDRAAIDAAIACSPAHHRPLLMTARDVGLDIIAIPQRSRPFKIAVSSRPHVSIIGDDTDCALGPSGFHIKSIARVFESADSAFMIGCAPDPLFYGAAAASAAFLNRKTVIIETRLAQEQAWITFVVAANPGIHMVIATAQGGEA